MHISIVYTAGWINLTVWSTVVPCKSHTISGGHGYIVKATQSGAQWCLVKATQSGGHGCIVKPCSLEHNGAL